MSKRPTEDMGSFPSKHSKCHSILHDFGEPLSRTHQSIGRLTDCLLAKSAHERCDPKLEGTDELLLLISELELNIAKDFKTAMDSTWHNANTRLLNVQQPPACPAPKTKTVSVTVTESKLRLLESNCDEMVACIEMKEREIDDLQYKLHSRLDCLAEDCFTLSDVLRVCHLQLDQAKCSASTDNLPTGDVVE